MFFNNLELNKNEVIYKQIEDHIIEMILSGVAPENAKLPSTRDLSKLLGVSRNSVITAYENLEASNYIYTLKSKGTFIGKNKLEKRDKWIINWKDKRNNYSKKAEELDIIKTEIPWSKDLISFKSISPDGESFDLDEFKKAFLNRISVEGHKILNYGYAKGYKPLINYLLAYMNNKGVNTEDKDIIITNGFTEGFEMIITAFLNKGDKVICENPTHNTSIKIMKVNDVDIIGININENGIDINDLKTKIEIEGIKLGYLTPSYHNPTGNVMSGEVRKAVYEIFKEKNIPIIEDGFNEELHYNTTHISPIAALDNGGGVVYIGSFSKVLFPGIRVGWILANKEVINTLESIKRCKNIHTSFLDQGILYEYLESGAFEKYIRKVRKLYKEKYDFALELIKKYIKQAKIYGEGGLHIYLELEKINSRELLNNCYKRKVIFTPGDVFSINDNINNKESSSIRLGLSRLTVDEIEKGIKIIGEEIKKLEDGYYGIS